MCYYNNEIIAKNRAENRADDTMSNCCNDPM